MMPPSRQSQIDDLTRRVKELEERLQAQLIQESKDAAKLTEFLDRIHELERNQPGIGDGDIRHALAGRDRYQDALELIASPELPRTNGDSDKEIAFAALLKP